MSGKHALLGASGAARWLACTPSARLEEQFPDSASTYAAEGNLAHAIAELKLRKTFVDPMGPRKFNNQLKKLKEHQLYQPEMLKHTDTYLEYVQGLVHGFDSPPYIAVEKRVDYSEYVPEGFGTADCIIIGGNTLWVIDLKYGKGVPVAAEDNPQMMLYALGAYSAYSFLYPIEKVVMAIVQPRLDSISEWEISTDVLLYWATNTVMGAAEKAFKGEGDFVPGEHCRFCRAKSLCRARSEFNTAIEVKYPDKPPLLSNDEVGQLLLKAQDLAKWVKDLEEYALAECLAGNEIPGWKAAEGRSVRQFTDTDAAFKVLIDAGYDEAVLYERKPITLSATEKLVGKKKFNELLASFVDKPPGKPTLVPESDKREPIKPNLEQIFKEENNE
jgi:hypothetical protein